MSNSDDRASGGLVGAVSPNIRALLEQDDSRWLQVIKMAELGTMSSMILHDIRQPLATIKGFTQILLHEAPQNGPNTHILSLILKQVEEVEVMTGVFLDFARSPSARLMPVGLHEPLERSLKVVASRLRGSRTEAIVKLPSHLPRVQGNPSALQQVLVNLLLNAVDACVQRGGDEPRKIWIQLRASADAEWVELLIADNGTGISPDHSARLFEYFFTTKPDGKGTGLGLSIAAEIVRLHGGLLEHVETSQLQTNPGERVATVFRISLPVSKPSEE